MSKEKYHLSERYQSLIDNALSESKQNNIIDRIWNRDHTVWKPAPDEISNRLGWLDCPNIPESRIAELDSFVSQVLSDGYTNAVLLGMGGSSLAPEVFSRVFGAKSGYLDLSILDSTHPDFIESLTKEIDLSRTLFIVSTKSGGTVETLSFMKYFYNLMIGKVGAEETPKHFIGITDPGSKLEQLGKDLNFRKVFLNDPDIGGRYAALSLFGLVPAALLGIDIRHLLKRAGQMADLCRRIDDNPGEKLGIIMGEMAKSGRDKITLLLSENIAPFGAWVEQLIAESTGKEGKGILPVLEPELLPAKYYSDDRLFVYLRFKGDKKLDSNIAELKQAGHPVVEFALDDIYDLGLEYFRWEIATAISGYRLGINPFDQPNVESAKVLAREMVARYIKEGSLPEPKVDLTENGISVIGENLGSSLVGTLDRFISDNLSRPGPRAYAAVQAYIKRSSKADTELREIKKAIEQKYKLAVTTGYGPRFLHSTGQLHKGDFGNGLFLIITDNPKTDLEIPDDAGKNSSRVSFGVLISAQADGDRAALTGAGRKVLMLKIKSDVISGLQVIKASVK